jgi:Mechanosensitive ion channel, conserved TM helix
MDKVDMLLEPVRIVLSQIGAFLPRLAVAFAVLVAGWLLAKIIRFTVVKALRAVNFNVLTEHAGMDGFLRQGGIESDTTDIFGTLIYWLVIFATLVIAFNSLGLTYVTDLFGQVVTFVPKVIVALLILAFGSYFARFIYNTVVAYCSNVGMQDAELLGKLSQYAIVVFVVLIALDQMNVGGDIIRQSFLVILAGVVFALALAFGIGGQRWAAGLLERWLPRPNKDDK